MWALCIRRTRTRRRTRVMLHLFRVMLHVFPVMLHVFPVMLQETRATLHETPATLQETPATLNETRATLHASASASASASAEYTKPLYASLTSSSLSVRQRPATVISSTVFNLDIVFSAITTTFLTVVYQSNTCTQIARPVWFNCTCQLRLRALQYMAIIYFAR